MKVRDVKARDVKAREPKDGVTRSRRRVPLARALAPSGVSGLPPELVSELHALSSVRRVLVAVDFDGVMAPLRPDRMAVRSLARNARAIEALTAAWGVDVSLLSGRRLSELSRISMAPDGVILVGSHGSEVAGADLDLAHEERDLHQRLLIAFESIARDRPGTEVEEKPIGVALHTRKCRREVALAATADAVLAVSKLRGAHLLVGKETIEGLVTHSTKGDALNRLRASLQPFVTVYLGDDKTDEQAFAVMRPSDISIKVGEGPTQARFRIERPAQVAPILRLITRSRPQAQREAAADPTLAAAQ